MSLVRQAIGGLVVVAVVTLMTGCSYKSEYKPPADGRARPIWDGDKAVMVAPEDLPRCAYETGPAQVTYVVPRDPDGYYRPRHRHHHHSHVHVVVVGGPVFFPPSPGLLALGALSGGKGDGEAFAVVLAVGAIIAFPFIAMGLAMGHPEPEEEVVDAVDRINTYNDELRERYAFCEALAGSQGVAP